MKNENVKQDEINNSILKMNESIEDDKLQWFQIAKSIIDTAIIRTDEWNLPIKISFEFQENHPNSEVYRKFF